MNHCIRSRQHFKVGNCWMWLQYCSPSNRVRVPSRNILPAWSKASWAPSMNIPSQKNRKRSIFNFALFLASLICTKKRAYGRCSRREIKGNEISTEPVLHNGSQPCHIPGANICFNGVEPFGKTLTFLRKKGVKPYDNVPCCFFHWYSVPKLKSFMQCYLFPLIIISFRQD